mmetsp:Transcript_156895/g.273088  ORF Transcript_156895/g.273088 Transcript_156895/m.273088 type:complete len:236 (+) Transcript_156895:64-771(+)
MRAMHSKIDSNGDGKISLPEIMDFAVVMRKTIAKKDIQTIIDEMDGDKDGKLSLPELLKDMEQWGEEGEEDKAEAQKRKDHEAEKFKVADSNGDGFLDSEELPALFYPETHDGVLELTAAQTMQHKDLNGDGKLTSKEFWEGDSVDGEELKISDEEEADFQKLDTDKDGFIQLEELKAWESGHFHTEEAMKKLIELSDKDSDMHVTADEFDEARELIAGSDAQYHMMEWAEHHEL